MLREKIAEIAYDLSEHQIQGVKDGFVTDFKVEQAIKDLLKAFEEALPEEIDEKEENIIYSSDYRQARNELLAEIKAKLK